mmetsp:Transcript_1755/g.6913  ORF Transcript_1755/g.6913 Transcript_1755/m.6913 type:complete len:547 (+) Transcript_1755:222-1862(+)
MAPGVRPGRRPGKQLSSLCWLCDRDGLLIERALPVDSELRQRPTAEPPGPTPQALAGAGGAGEGASGGAGSYPSSTSFWASSSEVISALVSRCRSRGATSPESRRTARSQSSLSDKLSRDLSAAGNSIGASSAQGSSGAGVASTDAVWEEEEVGQGSGGGVCSTGSKRLMGSTELPKSAPASRMGELHVSPEPPLKCVGVSAAGGEAACGAAGTAAGDGAGTEGASCEPSLPPAGPAPTPTAAAPTVATAAPEAPVPPPALGNRTPCQGRAEAGGKLKGSKRSPPSPSGVGNLHGAKGDGSAATGTALENDDEDGSTPVPVAEEGAGTGAAAAGAAAFGGGSGAGTVATASEAPTGTTTSEEAPRVEGSGSDEGSGAEELSEGTGGEAGGSGPEGTDEAWMREWIRRHEAMMRSISSSALGSCQTAVAAGNWASAGCGCCDGGGGGETRPMGPNSGTPRGVRAPPRVGVEATACPATRGPAPAVATHRPGPAPAAQGAGEAVAADEGGLGDQERGAGEKGRSEPAATPTPRPGRAPGEAKRTKAGA